MIRKKSFYTNTAKRIFFMQLAGTLTSIVLALFIYSGYQSYVTNIYRQKPVVNQIVRIISLARSVPAYELPQFLAARKSTFIQTSIDANPVDGAKQVSTLRAERIRSLLTSNPQGVKFTVPLDDGSWLNIQTQRTPEQTWLLVVIFATSVLLLFALVMLFLWSIKRLSMPLGDLATAATRIGVDVNAPPLAVTGPKELRAVVEAFNEMKARIQRLIHDRTQMLAAISHDLRTPITRLKLRAEHFEATPQYQKMIADLEEMEDMINSVLQFARQDIRDEPMERFDLEALLDSLCADLVDTGRKVNYDGFGQRLPFFGRTTALRRAFNNLIENAVKYGFEAQVHLNIRDDQAIIEIEDKGPGIPPSDLEKVFQAFYRVEHSRSRETGGTGLGLVVARDAIRAHDGDIELMNKVDGGLRAVVHMPLRDKEGT